MFSDFIHALLADAHPIDEQIVRGSQTCHCSSQGLGPHLRWWLHERQESFLIVTARVTLDLRVEVASGFDLLVLVDEITAFSLREMHEERDEARVIGAPAIDAVAHAVGKPLHGFPHQAQHAGTEIGTDEDRHAPVPCLIVNTLVKILVELLLEFSLQLFNLEVRLTCNDLDDLDFVRAKSIHCCLEILAVLVIIQRRSGVCALENSHQNVLE
mmetsp:Transcript_20598/g.37040  ORF Transcript_20598/g.37040 Transcript_20598/m.37040 type:complete len:213 (-) Transcript_20598:2337-2975(-)